MSRILAAVLSLVVTLPVFADFSAVARALESQGVNRISIPFLGLARLMVRMAQPEGIHDFQLATFEGGDDLDPKLVADIIRTKAGNGFRPLVQVWSRRSNEWSFIYVRPSGNAERLELMILARDGSETALVRVDVDANIIARELRDSPREVSKVAHH